MANCGQNNQTGIKHKQAAKPGKAGYQAVFPAMEMRFVVLLLVLLLLGNTCEARFRSTTQRNVSVSTVAEAMRSRTDNKMTTLSTMRFDYTGAVQTFIVPEFVTSITAELHGAAGGTLGVTAPGYGGAMTATIPVIPGESLKIYVGGVGTASVGGFNGGGTPSGGGGGGGGATDIRREPGTLNDRILVAGGGGGAYDACQAPGGNAGLPFATAGTDGCNYYGGGPGSVYEPGYTDGFADDNFADDQWYNFMCTLSSYDGSLGLGGNGCGNAGSGGGGGYYGGAGAYSCGGGGGASFSSLSGYTNVNGQNNGVGYVILTYTTVAPTSPTTLVYTGLPQLVTVPSWAVQITVELFGAAGGSTSFAGGKGGQGVSTFAVTPGELLVVMVGGMGHNFGGFNGGGSPTFENGGGGGGGSDVRRAPYGLSDRLMTVGGGGGAYSCALGGYGGYPTGGAGGAGSPPICTGNYPGGQPGGQSAGGAHSGSGTCTTASAGSLGTGGQQCGNSGPGGGGGYYGGGGSFGGGGGGGSTFLPPGGSSTNNVNAGNGYGTIAYLSAAPTIAPTVMPTPSPGPSAAPTVSPTGTPTVIPTAPTSQPSSQPSRQPSQQPSSRPTAQPSQQPSLQPTALPSSQPSRQPSCTPTNKPSEQPTSAPSQQPSGQPTTQPSFQPSSRPSTQPSRQPTAQSTSRPSTVPSVQPSGQPSGHPSQAPTQQPTAQPTNQPSASPSSQPLRQPTQQPSRQPSSAPSAQPTYQPSGAPSRQPSARPTSQPSAEPSNQPSAEPSRQPTQQPTRQPSSAPSVQPTTQPSSRPTRQPTRQPAMKPSGQPSARPSAQPTREPSRQPTSQPSAHPSAQPSSQPIGAPSRQPTNQPSVQPSTLPSALPTAPPSTQPSSQPSRQPSSQPFRQPSSAPSMQPSGQPSGWPSSSPTCQPSAQPSVQPSQQPSSQASLQPSSQPSNQPTSSPTWQPAGQPTGSPTKHPSNQPSMQPSGSPSIQPTVQPSAAPSVRPSFQPTVQPSGKPLACPSGVPSRQPSACPSLQPTVAPSSQPSGSPSVHPTFVPSSQPSKQPTTHPSVQLSATPTCQVTSQPSSQPTSIPSGQPSGQPAAQPTMLPSNQPSTQPTRQPTIQPSGVPTCRPSVLPSSQPSSVPSRQPSSTPSVLPTTFPSARPSSTPTRQPNSQPTSTPTWQSSARPSSQPSAGPSSEPVHPPTPKPTSPPTFGPTALPSTVPTIEQSNTPITAEPTCSPTTSPTRVPTTEPTAVFAVIPTRTPTVTPAAQSTNAPTAPSRTAPTATPTVLPSTSSPPVAPTLKPSTVPTRIPTKVPTAKPSVTPLPTTTTKPTLANAPTRKPSTKPTMEPTCIPSRIPTCAPSLMATHAPSIPPTHMPTQSPTESPTMVPTSTPTPVPTMVSVTAVTPRKDSLELELHNSGTIDAYAYCAAFPGAQYSLLSASAIKSIGTPVFAPPGESAVNITGLLPYSEYSVFCTAMSISGIEMDIAEVRQRRVVTSTLCCRPVRVELLIDRAKQNVVLHRAVVLSLDATPPTDLQLVLQFSNNDEEDDPPAVYPSVLHWSNRSIAGTFQYVTVVPGAVGLWSLNATLSGSSAAAYEVIITGHRSLLVVAPTAIPAVPVPTIAQLSNDGSSVALTFDSQTDKGGYHNLFPCRQLLNFTGDNKATCQWVSSAQIVIYPAYTISAPNNSLSAGGTVFVLEHKIRAACALQNVTECQHWGTVQERELQVARPANPVLPTVLIAMPSTLGGCSALLIDLTRSTGAAGRPWVSIVFSVFTEQGITAASRQLESFLNNNYTMSPPTPVPYTAFQKDYTYSIKVTLWNFLGACGTAVGSVAVDASQLLTPIVSIPGQSHRSVYGNEQLALYGSAYTQSCGGTISTLNMVYSWQIQRLLANGTYSTAALRSSSQSPTVFKLAAYSLQTNAVYKITFSATSRSTLVTASTEVTVVVLPGNIIAKITGGSTIYAQVGDALHLNASQSYDEDVLGSSGARAGISFEWNCVQTAPVFSPASPLFASALLQSLRRETLSTTVLPSALNTTSLCTATVFDSTRTSSAQVLVVVTGAAAPKLDITSGATLLSKINTGKKFVLYGTVDTPAPCWAVWSINNAGVDLRAASRTSVVQYMARSAHQGAMPFNLVLMENVLPQRTTLVFSLTCGSATTSVSVTTNGAPLPGIFEVLPFSGDALSTQFVFTADQWSDTDLPMTYEFRFRPPAALSALVLILKSEVSYATSTLPARSTEDGQAVGCMVHVYDSLNAVSSAGTSVKVKPVDAMQMSASLQQMVLSCTENVAITSNVVPVVTTALQSVNCTAVHHCVALNRAPCAATSGLCGACLEGCIGDAGDSNSLCIPVAEIVQVPADVHCSGVSDCSFGWQQCDAHSQLCVIPLKSCAHNCSSHGECAYINQATGTVQSSCRLDDPSCDAVCSCVDAYGGQFCEIDAETLHSNQLLRSSLIMSLYNLTTVEDINTATVTAWAANMFALSLRPYELTLGDTQVLTAIANITLRSAMILGTDAFENYIGVLQAIDAVASLMQHRSNAQRRLISSDTVEPNSDNVAATIVPIVSVFAELITASLVMGQNGTTLQYTNFRLAVQLAAVTADSEHLTLTSPQSEMEVLVGTPESTASLSPTPKASAAHAVALTVISVFPRSYTADASLFVSNPLMLQVRTMDPGHSQPREYLSWVNFTLQHNDFMPEYVQLSAVVNFTTVCTAEMSNSSHTFVCPDSGTVLTHNCIRGPGVHISYCPKPAPSCANLDVASAAFTAVRGCIVTGGDATYTTCSCSVVGSVDQHSSTNRALTTTESPLLDDSGVTNMVIATEYVSNDVGNTFTAADDFNSPSDAAAVVVVLIMLGVVWVPALLFVVSKELWPATTKEAHKVAPADTDVEAQKCVVEYIEKIIPDIFRTGTHRSVRLWNEMLQHHMLLQLGAAQSKRKHQLIVAKTATILMLMLCLIAVFFDLSDPSDDGTCDDLGTRDACLKRVSPMDNTQSYCEWVADSVGDGGVCSYGTQTMTTTALFYLTVLTTIITSIATIPLDYMFSIIAAPTAQSLKGSKVMHSALEVAAGVRRLSLTGATFGVRPPVIHIQPIDAGKRTAPPTPRSPRTTLLRGLSISQLLSAPTEVTVNREIPDEIVELSAAARRSVGTVQQNHSALVESSAKTAKSLLEHSQRRMTALQSTGMSNSQDSDNGVETRAVELTDQEQDTGQEASCAALRLLDAVICQRVLLNDGAEEVREFDKQWGVRKAQESQLYYICDAARIAIIDDIAAAEEMAEYKSAALDHLTVHHAGLEILHLFMVDLLGRNTPAAKIFQEKFGEEFEHSRVAVMWQKVASTGLLLCLNVLFAYYVILKAFEKGLQWQVQFLVCSIVQILVELLVFETTECIWLNFTVPSFVHQEVGVAAQKLRDHVQRLTSTAVSVIATANKGNGPSYFLDAPAQLFVSIKVAKAHPGLLESLIVSSYTHHLPGEICRTWPHYRAPAEDRQQREDRSTLFVLLTSLITGITLSMQMFLTIPYLYQRVIIRFVQPMIFSGISIVLFAAVESRESFIIMTCLLFAAGVALAVWMRHRARKLAVTTPDATAAETSSTEDPQVVAIDIRPIPTFIALEDEQPALSEQVCEKMYDEVAANEDHANESMSSTAYSYKHDDSDGAEDIYSVSTASAGSNSNINRSETINSLHDHALHSTHDIGINITGGSRSSSKHSSEYSSNERGEGVDNSSVCYTMSTATDFEEI